MTYIMSCVWLDYMVKYFQCKNCVGSSLKTKKCVASFLVPGDKTEEHRGVLFSFVRIESNAPAKAFLLASLAGAPPAKVYVFGSVSRGAPCQTSFFI